jgi:hypothetical protein
VIWIISRICLSLLVCVFFLWRTHYIKQCIGLVTCLKSALLDLRALTTDDERQQHLLKFGQRVLWKSCFLGLLSMILLIISVWGLLGIDGFRNLQT